MKFPSLFPLCLALAVLTAGGCRKSSVSTLDRALKHLENGSVHKAVAAFDKVTPQDRQNVTFYYNYAMAHAKIGNLVNAMEAVENGLAIEPGNPHLLKLLASIACDRNNWPLAREALEKATDGAPPTAYILNALGVVERYAGNTDIARLHFLNTMRLFPHYPAAYYNLASLYQDKFSQSLLADARDLFYTYSRFEQDVIPEKATNAVTRAEQITQQLSRAPVQTKPRNEPLAAQRLREGQNFFAARQYPQAERAFRDACTADPLSIDAHLALAAYYERRNDRANAYKTYVNASKLPFAPPTVFSKGADLAISQHTLAGAAELCSQGMARRPNDAMFYYQMANIRAQQRRYNDARAFAGYFVTLSPPGRFRDDVKSWANRLPK